MSEAILEELLVACRAYSGGDADRDLLRRTEAFVARARQEVSLLSEATSALPLLPPSGAGWLAVAIAGAIESGRGVERTAGPVVDLLLSWLPRLPVPVEGKGEDEEDSYPEPTPEQAELLAAFPHLCQSAVAHLARSPELRERLALDAALLDRLEGLQAYSHGAIWLRELLLRTSGPLIVLHPPSGRGFRLRYENVANCFHLFTLLQGVLAGRLTDGEQADAKTLEVAKGRQVAAVNDHAWWHYGDPRSPQPAIKASIWGEAEVRSIPQVNGTRTILLWPRILESRGWDAGFFHPFLEAAPPNVVLEAELSAGECRALLDQLGVKPAEARPWWQRLFRRS